MTGAAAEGCGSLLAEVGVIPEGAVLIGSAFDELELIVVGNWGVCWVRVLVEVVELPEEAGVLVNGVGVLILALIGVDVFC